ncbi:SAVMC3_10250 family protein [Streptomyces sp. NPDC093261]|uniref:SAVMC3_10250 family protein n=1 Tax=Streptomyces sp. NPDC093261 TaxID=3366037 RepID=UPI0038063BA3
MRELLYVSQTKLHTFHLPPRKFARLGSEVELSLPAARIRVSSPPDNAQGADMSAKLTQVAKRLRKEAKTSTDPSLSPGEWFFFDHEMSCGTAEVVSGDFPHVALFYPDRTDSGLWWDGPVLCGSAGHLTFPQADLGRPANGTSNLRWLFRRIDEDERGLHRFDDTASSVRRAIGGLVDKLDRTRGHYLVNLRLSGLARALYVCPPATDPPRLGMHAEGRLVVGTPLYVEVGPWNPKW